ncbi:MAG TPA: hypothetical protein VK133_00745 [Amoebophilaceae bacterium]|nr:hypothetical protein [Amoebophilaceae bacterium]
MDTQKSKNQALIEKRGGKHLAKRGKREQAQGQYGQDAHLHLNSDWVYLELLRKS